jgi:hypothetical protein
MQIKLFFCVVIQPRELYKQNYLQCKYNIFRSIIINNIRRIVTKKVLFLLILFSSLLSAQNIFFSEPTSTHTDYIWATGRGPVDYSIYLASGWQGHSYYAMLKYPDGTTTNWQYGQTGGWWVIKAGTYQIQGKAYATLLPFGQTQWIYRSYFSFSVVDNYAPAVPQNFSVSAPYGESPVLTWSANTEYDLEGYRVYRKHTNSSGTSTSSTFTTNTSYTDGDFTCDHKYGDDTAEYWVVAEDINDHTSEESSHIIIDGTSYLHWKINGGEDNKMDYFLSQNYPNPFNPSTSITFQIKEKGFVTLKVYDVLGKLVFDLINETKEAGEYSVTFDASDLPSGVYIYSLMVNDFVQNKKMSLMK